MLRPIDQYFLQLDEQNKSCLEFLRDYLLSKDALITEAWKYSMPFYNYNGKRFCYLWVHKKYKQPYIGFVEGKWIEDPELMSENRARMKILLLDPNKDLPMAKIEHLLNSILKHYE